VLGTIFAAGVHDFGSLAVSLRHRAKNIGTIAHDVISKRARTLFLLIIFFLVASFYSVTRGIQFSLPRHDEAALTAEPEAAEVEPEAAEEPEVAAEPASEEAAEGDQDEQPGEGEQQGQSA